MSHQMAEAVDPASLARYDAIIDVRSPSEFQEDHIPGAENLPVLDDAERAVVGTMYVQESRFLARRTGAALVARNIARHLENALADRPASFQPLVYCWRGGQRSAAMGLILSQVGWTTRVLSGGYRTYRRHVTARLYDEGPASLQLILLDGHTGSAKTEVLHRLARRGVQTIDLEGLAEHRGSLFGGRPGRSQPSQKMFESRLLAAMQGLDPARPVVVEAESSKIGDRMTPPALWAAMRQAPRLALVAPSEARARYLVAAYGEIAQDRAALDEVLCRLPVSPSEKRLETWRGWIDAGDLDLLAQALMDLHYDPAYNRSSRKDERPVVAEIPIDPLDEASLEAAVDQVMAEVAARFGAV